MDEKKELCFNKEIVIANRRISENARTFIIAEAGVNHNGSIDVAKKLIDEACAAGADAVKFQSFRTEHLILKNVDKANYQKISTKHVESQYEMLSKLEMPIEKMRVLSDYARSQNIVFLSTPFEETSLSDVCNLGVPAVKIAATDITNIKFLRQIARRKKPIILSAGMCYLDEIKKALEAITPFNRDVILLQCTANYPILDEEVNLRVIETLKKEFDILVGYSDHSSGVGASPYAVAMGAVLVEKHFTLSRTQDGPDHKASIEPFELKKLVQTIRTVEKYRGTDIKEPTISEQMNRKSLQKCLVASCDIEKGDFFSESNLDAKRTNGIGMSAIRYDDVIGTRACRNYKKDEIIECEGTNS